MPIEIRELVIKTRVEENASGGQQPAETGAGNGMGAGLSPGQMEKLVSLILERVMDALKQQNER